jgi:cobalt-zinc-cadmium efflux system protein
MSRRNRLTLALVLNIGLSVGLVIAGRAAHSTGLIADAGHNLTDAMAILLVLGADLLSRRPATTRRSFGLQRATILAALANGVVLIAVTSSIVWLAVERLLHPGTVQGSIVLIAASASALLNLAVVSLLVEDHHDLSVRSALLHAVGDVLGSSVVALSGLVAMIASGPLVQRIDPIASLVVAALIIVEALRITRSSLHILLEGVPTDLDLEVVRAAICETDQIVEVHDLHVWALSSESRAMSAHVVVQGDPTLSDAEGLLVAAKALLAERFAINHATIELESSSCADDLRHR